MDRVFIDRFESEEELTRPQWVLSPDSSMQIGEYLCSKATTTLYGRQWTAWYTQQMSRPDGPWLLHGLPGVVVSAYEETGRYRFDLSSIEKKEMPIKFYGGAFYAPRNQVLKQRRTYYRDRRKYIKSSDVGHQTQGLSNTTEVPFEPLRKIVE